MPALTRAQCRRLGIVVKSLFDEEPCGPVQDSVDAINEQVPVSSPRVGVYVLEYPDQHFYVGKSKNIDRRIAEHQARGGVWNGPFIEVACAGVPIPHDLEAWERSETLLRMRMHGMDNVRGWMYTMRELSPMDRGQIRRQWIEIGRAHV